MACENDTKTDVNYQRVGPKRRVLSQACYSRIFDSLWIIMTHDVIRVGQ